MREQPWDQRIATHYHYHWYENLLDLHQLTSAWLKDLDLERPSWFTGPHVSPRIRDTIGRFEKAAGPEHKIESLETLLDDTLPEDLLGRFNETVETVQAWVLQSSLDQATSTNKDFLLSRMGQASWRAGRECSIKRWKEPSRQGMDDLRGVLASFKTSPILGFPSEDGLLVCRATSSEIILELRACPHQSSNPAVHRVADELCQLQSHWIRGFVYPLNSKICVDHSRTGNICSQRWYLLS